MHYNDGNSYLFVNGKEIYKYKASSEIDNFLTRLFLGSISDVFHATESIEESLGRNVYDFFVDYNAINKSNILDIHNYLMFKNNIK